MYARIFWKFKDKAAISDDVLSLHPALDVDVEEGGN